jgi:hypothetical protein
VGRFWQKQKRTGLGLEQLSFTVFLGGTFWRDVLWGFRKVTIFQETCFWVGFTMPKGRGCELPQLRKRLSGGAVNSPDTVSKSLSATNNRFNLSMKRASQCGAASSHTAISKKNNYLGGFFGCDLLALQPPCDPTRVDGVLDESTLVIVVEDASDFRHLQIIQHRIDISGLGT